MLWRKSLIAGVLLALLAITGGSAGTKLAKGSKVALVVSRGRH